MTDIAVSITNATPVAIDIANVTPVTLALESGTNPFPFKTLTDAPSTYSGQSGKYVVVKSTEDGVEFTSPSSLNTKVKVTTNDTTSGYLNSKLSAGTGISLNLTNTSANEVLQVVNSDPDQTVALTEGTSITITGTYPNFTITNSDPDQVVTLTGGTSISISGSYPDFTITNSDPDQVVSISGGTNVTVGGTYPTFAITDNSINNSDLTAVAITTNANYNGSDCGGSTGTTGRTLTHTKDLGNQTIIFKNRAILHPTIDYTTSSAIITFNVYVDDGDTITVMA